MQPSLEQFIPKRGTTITVPVEEYFKNKRKFLINMVELYASSKNVAMLNSPYPWTKKDVDEAVDAMLMDKELIDSLKVDLPEPTHTESTFLGKEISQAKLDHIEELRTAMGSVMGKMHASYELGEVSARDYAEQFNRFQHSMFINMEQVLGQTEFIDLFGMTAESMPDALDVEAFIASEAERTAENQ